MTSDRKKVQKYCRIFNWIKDTDEELAEVMVNLCVDRIADTSKRYPAVTFLMPKGKLRTQIIDLAYSTEPEKAVDMIISLVIPYGFHSIESFNSAQAGHIGNKLRYVFPKIDKPNDKTVNFDNKLVIRQAQPKLVPRDNSKIYVYDIETGEPPNNYNKMVAKQEYNAPEPPKNIKGGACTEDPMDLLSKKPRALFAQAVEQIARDEIQKIHTKNPYLPVVVLLLQHILQAQYCDLFVRIRPILDLDPIITFYLLVEPYKLVGEYIISDDIFNARVFDKILKARALYNDPAAEYRKILNRPVESDANIFSHTKDIIELINSVRFKLLNEEEARKLPEEVLAVYNGLIEKNEIKSVVSDHPTITNILPDSLLIHYQNNYNKRLWQDEYRFIIGECIRSMKTEINIEARTVIFDNLCNTLKETLRGDDYSDELCIMNYSDYALSACVRDRIRMMQYFINSPDFLFIGCRLELICVQSSPIEHPQGSNRHLMAEKALQVPYYPDVTTIEDILYNMNPDYREKLLTHLQSRIETEPPPTHPTYLNSTDLNE